MSTVNTKFTCNYITTSCHHNWSYHKDNSGPTIQTAESSYNLHEYNRIYHSVSSHRFSWHTSSSTTLQLEVDWISASVSAPNVDKWALSVDIRTWFGFGWKQSYHIRCTFGFGMLQFANSVVAESLSCGGRECARRRESLASLSTDWLCKDNQERWLCCLRLHLVL